jgi:hypothetical protein
MGCVLWVVCYELWVMSFWVSKKLKNPVQIFSGTGFLINMSCQSEPVEDLIHNFLCDGLAILQTYFYQ